MTCPYCDGSGVVQIVLTVHMDTGTVDPEPYASPCHHCPAGAAWTEAFEEVMPDEASRLPG